VYEFEKVALSEKGKVVKQRALLNLKQNKFIDSNNEQFAEIIKNFSGNKKS